jgi:hypothetical protein
MIELGEPGFYEVTADQHENKIKIVFSGDIKNVEKMSSYVENVKKAVKEVSKGFALLVDIKPESTSPGFQMSRWLKESQVILNHAGVAKTAVVQDPKLILQKMTLLTVTKLSGINLKVFSVLEQAEMWLSNQ